MLSFTLWPTPRDPSRTVFIETTGPLWCPTYSWVLCSYIPKICLVCCLKHLYLGRQSLHHSAFPNTTFRTKFPLKWATTVPGEPR